MIDAPKVLTYRLESSDLAVWCSHHRRYACLAQCRGWFVSLAILLVLAGTLSVAVARTGGSHAIAILFGTLGLVAVAIIAIREVVARHRCRALARAMGLPREVELIVSPDGITQAPDHAGLGRTFRWHEVAGVYHHGHVTAVKLRVADASLLIPDRAFASTDDRQALIRDLRRSVTQDEAS